MRDLTDVRKGSRSKYDRLSDFLRTIAADEVVMTFRQLEEIVSLPHAARERASWWRDQRDAAQVKAWWSVGYDACPDILRKEVTFRKRDPVRK